jgi:myo-inositol-1(or 4)-monophosphatase
MDETRAHDDGLATLVAAARLGGEIALASFRHGAETSASVAYKAGDSPVTSADLAVDAKLADILRAAFPQAGWLSEETEDDKARLGAVQVLVVDPIDGTRAFMSGDPHWAVSVALVEHGRPVAGVLHAPALGETFAAARGMGATLNGQPIRAAQLQSLDGARIAGPRPLAQAFLAQARMRLDFAPRVPSLALRLAGVAAGSYAVSLAGAHSHDWDIAAADIILHEAGAGLLEGGRQVRYNQLRPRHDPLLAAPAEWLARLAPAFAAARRA